MDNAQQILANISLTLLFLLFIILLIYVLFRGSSESFVDTTQNPPIESFKLKNGLKILGKMIMTIIAFIAAYFFNALMPLERILSCPSSSGVLVIICFLIGIGFMAITRGISRLIKAKTIRGDILIIFLIILSGYNISFYLLNLHTTSDHDLLFTGCFTYYITAAFIGCYLQVALKFLSAPDSKNKPPKLEV